MNLKKGVSIQLIQPQIILALIIANEIWKELGQDLVITAGNEYSDKHSITSYHYQGLAVDLRTRYFAAHEKLTAFQNLKRNLGESFDVVFHPTHIHIEFDPNNEMLKSK